jgi:D-alanyl-D-alanine carboxypeptidase
MFRANTGISRGSSCIVLGLAVVLAAVAMTTDSADARARRKRGGQSSYSPPYAAIVVDANSGGVLHAVNPDSPRHPASLTKIMTLYLLFERLEAGKLKLSTSLKVSASAASQAPSKLGLEPGSTIEVEDAIRALVTKSANDIAVVIAEAIAGDEEDFAALMTQKARAIGMTRTLYRNASGLPDDEQVTTARDQALLGRAIQERFPRHYRYFATPSFRFRGNVMRNHNRLLGQVEGLDGIKTGYTLASGFNLVTSVRRNNRHIVAVVLGGSSAGARDARMRGLIAEHLAQASPRRTASALVSVQEDTRSTSSANAAEKAPARKPAAQSADATAVAAVADTRPAAGSVDPIKPILVKTVRVKLGAVQTASLAPRLPVPNPVREEQVQAQPEPTARPADPVEDARDSSPPPVESKSADAVEPAQIVNVLPADADKKFAGVTPAKSEGRTPAPARAHSGWMIQIGAFDAEKEAQQRLSSAQTKARALLAKADPFTEAIVKGDKTYYRARFAGLDKEQAEAACKHLKRNDIVCMTIRN